MKMRLFTSLLALATASSMTGCAMFRASTQNVDVTQEKHMGADYDFSDMRNVSESVAAELMGSEFLAKNSTPPIFVIAGVENRTSSYVDTKGLTDKIRTSMIRANKGQFVNESRREDLLKEQGYQAANATPETQAAVGRQLGAKYMISGSLMEMKDKSPKQVRISKQKLRYYKLTMEVTDLETGLISWTTEQEFARQESVPLIGW